MTRTALAGARLALQAALAGTGSAAPEGPPTNADVVALTEAGLGQSVEQRVQVIESQGSSSQILESFPLGVPR